MRFFSLFAVLLVHAPFCTLQAASPWRLESSATLPSRSPAVVFQTLSLQNDRALEMHLVRFNRTRCSLRVLDLPPGGTVAQALRTNGALAGVNGGYFTLDHSPIGLVVCKGVKLHPQENAKILTGVLAVTPRGANLLRTSEFKTGPDLQEALQAGPFLVDHGKAVGGLNANRRAERTVLLADSQGVVALLTTGPVTLAELGQILATSGLLPDLKIDRALNLDGGSSTALWVAADPTPTSRPEWKAVRNAVAIVPSAKPR